MTMNQTTVMVSQHVCGRRSWRSGACSEGRHRAPRGMWVAGFCGVAGVAAPYSWRLCSDDCEPQHSRIERRCGECPRMLYWLRFRLEVVGVEIRWHGTAAAKTGFGNGTARAALHAARRQVAIVVEGDERKEES